MRRLLIFTGIVFVTSGVYTITNYVPCQPHGELLVEGRIIPAESCSGWSFDNTLLAMMSLAVLVAYVRMLIDTRAWSIRGLGIVALLGIFLGTFGRAVVLPRLLGFPPLTLYELRLLRALLTWGAPLFAIGTFVVYRKGGANADHEIE